jgi:hypothetical protein
MNYNIYSYPEDLNEDAKQNLDQFNFLIGEASHMIINDKADEDRMFKTF